VADAKTANNLRFSNENLFTAWGLDHATLFARLFGLPLDFKKIQLVRDIECKNPTQWRLVMIGKQFMGQRRERL